CLLDCPYARGLRCSFYAYVDHRALHSFPTRRSSDLECGVLEGGADVERWVRTRVEATGVKIEEPAARLLAERCGTDVRRLRNDRSEEHTSELQSPDHLVCRLLLEKKKKLDQT